MKLSILKTDGSDSGEKANFKKAIFEGEINDYAVYQSVRLSQANSRQGTHKTKGRSEVSGGGRKPFRQKGTGNARQGTIRAPHMTGGGRVFGPEPRDYGFKLNKKYKKQARRSAFAAKVASKEILVVEDFKLDLPKTKYIVELMAALKVAGKRVLFLTAENDLILHKSSRNVKYVKSMEARNVSSYDLLESNVVIVQKSAVKVLHEVLG